MGAREPELAARSCVRVGFDPALWGLGPNAGPLGRWQLAGGRLRRAKRSVRQRTNKQQQQQHQQCRDLNGTCGYEPYAKASVCEQRSSTLRAQERLIAAETLPRHRMLLPPLRRLALSTFGMAGQHAEEAANSLVVGLRLPRQLCA